MDFPRDNRPYNTIMENLPTLRKLSGPLTQKIRASRSCPLGATLSLGGANFSVYSKHATAIELLLFDCVDDARPARVIRIDPSTNRTYHYWHVFVPGVRAGQIYGYRVEGPYDPSSGMRFDPAKVLLDPYGRGTVVPKNYSREAARKEGDNCATAMKSVVVDPACLRLGRRHATQPALLSDDHLRNACARLHPASELRRRGEKTRHLCGSDRENSVSAASSA